MRLPENVKKTAILTGVWFFLYNWLVKGLLNHMCYVLLLCKSILFMFFVICLAKASVGLIEAAIDQSIALIVYPKLILDKIRATDLTDTLVRQIICRRTCFFYPILGKKKYAGWVSGDFVLAIRNFSHACFETTTLFSSQNTEYL